MFGKVRQVDSQLQDTSNPGSPILGCVRLGSPKRAKVSWTHFVIQPPWFFWGYCFFSYPELEFVDGVLMNEMQLESVLYMVVMFEVYFPKLLEGDIRMMEHLNCFEFCTDLSLLVTLYSIQAAIKICIVQVSVTVSVWALHRAWRCMSMTFTQK